jgi:hypothetical protein
MSSITLKGFKKEIEYEKICISSLRKLDSGGQMAGVSYGEQKNRLVIQTPLMSIPYSFGKGYNGVPSHDLNLSFGDYKTDPKLVLFYENMIDLEKYVFNHVKKNIDTWYPNLVGKSEDSIEDLLNENFNKFIRHSKDNKYPPTIKVKIPYDKDTDKHTISIVDMYTNKEYVFDDIKDKLQGAYVKICFRISTVYNISKHFGITAQVSKIKISFPAKDDDEFRSDSEDEATVAKKMSAAVIEDDEIDPEIKAECDKKAKKSAPIKPAPKDSEEEEEDDEEPDDDDDNNDSEEEKKPSKDTKKELIEPEDESDEDSDEPIKKPAIVKKAVVKTPKKVSK